MVFMMRSVATRGTFLHHVSPASSSVRLSEQCRQFSTDNAAESDNDKGVYPVYVHHLSKVVLEHLQESRNDWVMEQGLHRGLKLKANGTFVLRFPSKKGQATDPGRIWTSYDPVNKKHWLSVSRESLVGRFMLQDNTKNSSHPESTPERVQANVDKMIKVINEMQESTTARKEK